MKKILSLVLALIFLTTVFAGCVADSEITMGSGSNNAVDSNLPNIQNNNVGIMTNSSSEEEFHKIVSETQELLDIVADDIYTYWYDCIYNDKYLDDINYAIAFAINDNKENMDQIEANNETIKALYTTVRDGRLKAEAKAVMQAYNDYYSFVMEVSGSFNSFSADKESLKKELASALKDFEFEL